MITYLNHIDILVRERNHYTFSGSFDVYVPREPIYRANIRLRPFDSGDWMWKREFLLVYLYTNKTPGYPFVDVI